MATLNTYEVQLEAAAYPFRIRVYPASTLSGPAVVWMQTLRRIAVALTLT